MIWLARRIQRDFANWDRPTQVAFVLALLMGIGGVALTALAPQERRANIAIGVGALLLVAEIAVLWGGRGSVTAYTAAQRDYLAGRLESARALLEKARESGRADMRALTLLGATYRQFGSLDESEQVLYEALDKAPDHHYPLYNLGRTRLSMGRYTEAAALLERAIAAGAPTSAAFDLGEAYLLSGDTQRAMPLFAPDAVQDVHRGSMASWWRWHYGGQAEAPDLDVLRAGMPYWTAAAERFAATPYGQAVQVNIDAIQRYLRSVEDVG